MPPFRRAKPSTGPSEGLDTVLDLTVEGLEASKDTIVDALSVPGMGTVMSVAIGILKKVQAAKLNCAALGSLQTETESLVHTLQGLAKAIKTALPVDVYPEGSSARNNIKDEAFKSAGLADRVDELASVLKEVSHKAGELNRRNCVTRVLHSSGDTRAINDMKDSIVVAHRNFQTVGGVMIEAKVTTALNDIKIVIAKQDAAEEQRVLDSIPHVDGALYGSAVNAMKARLQEGTREAIFAFLKEWANAQLRNGEDSTPVLVFVGEAGTGKSTVASEFAKRLETEDHLPAATYFFTRGETDLASPTKVIPTLAWQLAQPEGALRRHIVDGAREHLKAGTVQQLDRQSKDLIGKPVSLLPSSHSPIFIVIDGLDECTDEGPQLVPILLRLLLSAALQPGSPLRLFLVTRPEPQYIHAVFDEPAFKPHISRITMQQFRSTADNDIDRFIRAKLAKDEKSRAWLDQDPYIIQNLVEKSDGLFIYAETAVTFILDGLHGIRSMQHRYTDLTSGTAIKGLAALDTLYRTVLEDVVLPADDCSEVRKNLKRILQYLVAVLDEDGISPATLEALTGMSTDESVPILNKLRSVVVFERDDVDSKFRIIHATFREFLVDRSRAGEVFYVCAEEAHGRLADECTAAMRSFVAKNWTNTAADAMVILQFMIYPGPSATHFRYACHFHDDHLRLRTSTPQDPESRVIVDGEPHPIPSFVSCSRRARDHVLWDLVCTVVKQLRGSLSGGGIWQDVVSLLDNLVQDTSRLAWQELVAALSIILDIEAIKSRCVLDATPGGQVCTTTGTGATLDIQHVQDLAAALNKVSTADDIYGALEEAHEHFHSAIVAAGLTPGHPYEDELEEYRKRMGWD